MRHSGTRRQLIAGHQFPSVGVTDVTLGDARTDSVRRLLVVHPSRHSLVQLCCQSVVQRCRLSVVYSQASRDTIMEAVSSRRLRSPRD